MGHLLSRFFLEIYYKKENYAVKAFSLLYTQTSPGHDLILFDPVTPEMLE